MTGIEAVGGKIAGEVVGAAAKAVGKAALAEDAKERERLLKIAEESGQLDKAALIRARRSVASQFIRLKLTELPARLLGAPREYFNIDFYDDLAERMTDVPKDDVVVPKASVAGPAMLGLGFSLEETAN